jgi:N-acetylneuraminic acid mutarotase
MSADGKLYLFGGWGGGGLSVSAANAYDTAHNQWVPLPDMLNSRIAPAGAMSGGLIYSLGGYVDMAPPVIDTVKAEAFNPGTQAWSAVPPPPSPPSYASAVSGPDGRIYLFGNGSTQIFDPTTSTWDAGTPMPTGRWCTATVVGQDALIYVIAGTPWFGSGTSNLSSPQATVEAYDPSSDHWISKPSLAVPRTCPAAVALPTGPIYVVGGLDSNDVGLGAVEVFDFKTTAWSSAPSLVHPRGALAAGLGADGRIYAACGETRGGFIYTVSSAEAYLPGAASWLSSP